MPRDHRASAIGVAFEMGRPSDALKTFRMGGGVLLALLVFASSPAHRAQAQSGPPGSGWVLTFDDEFNGNSLDLSKWGYVPANFDYNLAAQSQSEPGNVVEGNGVLQLITNLIDPNGPATVSNTATGQIWTRGTFTPQYGWFECRCKMAPGAGMDEAIVLYSLWTPTSEYQEIDMPEWLGNRPNTLYLAHWFVPSGGAWSGTMVSPTGPDWSADFHTYAINWQPDSITYYVDGIQYWQTTDHIPQEPMYLTIGSGASSGWGGNINASTCPNSMVLDYVRVWQGGGTTPPPPPPPPPSVALVADPNYTQQTQGNGNPLTAPWSGTGPAMIGLDSNNGNGPSPTPCGFIFSPAGTGWSAITQTGTLSPNTTYTLSAMIQTSSPFPGGSLGIQTPDGSTVLAEQSYGEQDGYAQVSVSFNSGSATTLTVFAGLLNNSGSNAWIHADNWRLSTGNTSGNLVQDPAFENQTQPGGAPLVAPWGFNGPALIGVDDNSGMNGSHCGYIYDGGTGAWSDIVQRVSVTPNTNYTLSCFIQTDGVFPAQGTMGAYVGNGNVLGSQSYGQMTNFTQLKLSFNSGSNTSVVIFAGFSDQGSGAWIHVDNWNLQ